MFHARIVGSAFALLLLLSPSAQAREVNLTGAVRGGSRMCDRGGCQRTEENRQTFVFVLNTKGEVARVRLRGRVYSADIDRVVVRLSECSLGLKTYLAGGRCGANEVGPGTGASSATGAGPGTGAAPGGMKP